MGQSCVPGADGSRMWHTRKARRVQQRGVSAIHSLFLGFLNAVGFENFHCSHLPSFFLMKGYEGIF